MTRDNLNIAVAFPDFNTLEFWHAHVDLHIIKFPLGISQIVSQIIFTWDST